MTHFEKLSVINPPPPPTICVYECWYDYMSVKTGLLFRQKSMQIKHKMCVHMHKKKCEWWLSRDNKHSGNVYFSELRGFITRVKRKIRVKRKKLFSLQ